MMLPLDAAGARRDPPDAPGYSGDLDLAGPSDATIAPAREGGRGTRPPPLPASTRSSDPLAADEAARLEHAVLRLVRHDPDASAMRRLSRGQAIVAAVLASALVAGLAVVPAATLAVVFALGTAPGLAILALRLAALRLPAAGGVVATDAVGEGAAFDASDDDGDLPVYTILVPLYREAEVVPQLAAALAALDYPEQRLEILLIVERDDVATKAAIGRLAPAPHIRVVEVPRGAPRTKPRALGYGLAFATGEYVVVYDAEDQPEPDQLRRAVRAFRAGPGAPGCLQARLNVYNPAESWLTRQFTVEYTALFDAILPTLALYRLPVMLGGTSNHFPRQVLEEVHGWDPFNVTEDADLGLRLARAGHRVAVLASTTWEEAPPRLGVWLGQRTRWLKGWMQTWLVHMRAPRRLWREAGARGFAAVNLLHGGAVLTALAHPWIILVLLWEAARGTLLDPGGGLGPVVLGLAGLNLAASYWAAIALGRKAVAARGRAWLGRSALLLPLYWLAISLAAHRALIELVTDPHHWEKTAHAGRSGADATRVGRPRGPG